MRINNINIIIVEAFSNKSIYRINKLHDSVISVYTDEIFWMKEMLLNIGIRYLLKRQVEKIGWLDCDITFKDTLFQKKILESLETNNIVQVFSTCQTGNDNTKRYSVCKISKNINELYTNLIKRHGEIGYGYAYRSEVLRKVRLYENAIVGTGDWINIIGSIKTTNVKNLYNDRFFRGTNINFFNDFLRWQKIMCSCCNNKIGFADNSIQILEHGSYIKRQYVTREKIIKKNNFNPNFDLINENKIPTLINKKLKYDIKNYFLSRHEDETLNNEIKKQANYVIKKYKFFDKINKEVKINTLKNIVENNRIIENFLIKSHHPTGNEKVENNVRFQKILSLHTDADSSDDTFAENTILFRKFGKQKPNETKLKYNLNSTCHTYLTYIVENYNKLPEHLVFMTDLNDNSKYTSNYLTNNIKKNNYKFFSLVDLNNNLPVEFLENWFNCNLPAMKIKLHTRINSFYASCDDIKKNKLSVYENLLKNYLIKQTKYTEMCYQYIWSELLK